MMLQVKNGTQQIRKTPESIELKHVEIVFLSEIDDGVAFKILFLISEENFFNDFSNELSHEHYASNERKQCECLPSFRNLTTQRREMYRKKALSKTHPFIVTAVKSLLKVTLTQTRNLKAFFA
jgi:hypothetical protein